MPDNITQRAALALGVPVDTVRRIGQSAPYRYKVYEIPKRSGAGQRTIAQPAKEVKAIQRWLIAAELNSLPVHDAATAYQSGSSIRENAARHARGNFLLKADFRDFFPSIRDRDVRHHIVRHFGDRYTSAEMTFICRVLLWRPERLAELRLSIGAPSSPFISNTIMFEFDALVDEYCRERRVTYSRYADDLAFSTCESNVLLTLPGFLRDALRTLDYPLIWLNQRKTVSSSRKHHRSVTGLVLSSQGGVSLGRDRKRLLRAMVYRFQQGQLPPEDCSRLRGLIAFAEDVEPEFVRRLADHYTSETLSAIRRYSPPSSN